MSTEEVKLDTEMDNKESVNKCVSCEKEFKQVEELKGHIRRGSCNGMDDPIDIYVNEVLEQLENIVGGDEINATNILLFSLNLEQVVERYKDLKGKQKKELVLRVFKRYAEKHNSELGHLLDFLPGFIDVSISLDRGDAKIQIDAEQVVTCCVGMLNTCLASKKKKN